MESEIWKPISGYEGLYEVSNLGRVKSLSRFQSTTERILKGEYDNRGYYRVRLSKENITKKFQIHRLVASVFIKNPSFVRLQINHIDGNPSNNNVSNLEWCTHSENMKHAFKTGLQSLKGEKNTQSKLTEPDIIYIRKLLRYGVYQKDIAKEFGVSRRCITDINIGKTWCSV